MHHFLMSIYSVCAGVAPTYKDFQWENRTSIDGQRVTHWLAQ